jgi:hypothetical protein
VHACLVTEADHDDGARNQIQQKLEAEDYHGMADAAVKLQYLVKVRDEAKHKAHTFQIQDKNQITMH